MTQRCKGGFAVQTESGPLVFAAGRLVSDEDPILKTHGHLFEAVEAQVARQEAVPQSVTAVAMETASAAPGEVRQTSTARRRAGQGDGAQ
jgi:predicted RecB family nuclease